MKIHVRFAVAAALSLFAAASARAQDNKPGGLNKVAHDVSSTVKKAGRDTKAEVKRDAGTTHHALQDAGNNTKTALKKTTGIKGSQSKHPGGLNKVARNISSAGKTVGRSARAEKDRAKSSAHGTLTETGKDIKAKTP
ncbi:MAG TPA: hypothetical protein VGG84_14590 [Gemmatimonadaceae bacterium]